MKTDINKLIPSFEAVLFASGEPVEISRFSQIFDVDEDDVVKVMELLADKLDKTESSIELVRLNFSYQLCTKKEYADCIRTALDLRKRTPLSQAAFEVLAVVAYNQPVTKAFIEQVRGVDCSGVVSTLVEKGLLEEKGKLELPGRPLLYGTTDNFLRCFSLKSLDELPEIPNDEITIDADGQMKLLSDDFMKIAEQMKEEIASSEFDDE